MALKDWKKVGKDEWKKNGVIVRVDKYEFYHPQSNGKWRCLVHHPMNRKTLVFKTFRIKSLALKFAKTYMRKH